MGRVSGLLRTSWAQLVVVILIAIFLRFYQLDTIPLGLHSDEAFKGYAATKYILQGREFPIFFEENLGEEPLYIYCIAGLFTLLGQSAFVIRAASAIIGVVTIPALYVLTRELIPTEDSKTDACSVGLMAALWLALSYWHLNYSRLGIEPVLFPLFIIVTCYFLWRATRTERTSDYLVAGLFLGLSAYTYRAARVVPLMLLLYGASCVLLSQRPDRRLLFNWLVLFAFAGLAVSPLAYFGLTHSDIFFSREGDVSVFNPELNQGSAPRALIASAVRTIASFHLWPDPNWRQNPAGRPLLDPITGLFFLLGLGITIRRWRSPNYRFILVWLLVMALPAVLTVSGLPHSSRSIGLLPLTCILPAIGMHEGIKRLGRRRIPKCVIPIQPVVTVVLFLMVALLTYRDYFTAWAREELPPAFDVAFVEASEVMNAMTEPRGTWILPLSSLADPGSVHYTVEFLYTGSAPHHFLRGDEATVAQELTRITQERAAAWLIRWDASVLGGAYLYHSDPKGVLSFLLDKHAEEIDTKEFHAFDVASYRLPDAPRFAIADSFRPLNVNFNNQVILRGIDFGPSYKGTASISPDTATPPVHSGEDTWVTLQWEALTPLSTDYKAAVYLLDGRSRLLGQADKVMLSNDLRKSSEWQAGKLALDYYTVSNMPATPPGEYHIEVAVYDGETLDRLPVLDDQGKISGQSFRAGTIQVVKPLMPPRVEPQVTLHERDLAPDIRLLGYDFPTREVAPGGTLRVALYWQALQDVQRDYVLAVELTDTIGDIWAEQRNRPVDGTYPSTEWDKDEILRDWHDVALPPDTPQGTYELFVKLIEGEVPLAQESLGEVEVRGRPHRFTVPEIQYPLDMRLGQSIGLLGYDLEDEKVTAGGVLRLVLYWQATSEMKVSYTVFTHLLDANDQIWAQKDSIPGGGSVPTTGWIEGEVIADAYDLAVDANARDGEYWLEIGMYDAATGERLPVYDMAGESVGDRVLLGAVQVGP